MAEGPRESSEELDSECLFSPTCGRNICIDGCTAKWIKNDSEGRFFIDRSLSPDEEIVLTFSGKGHAEVGIISIDPITITDASHVGNIKELTVIQTARIYKQVGTTKIKRSKEGDRIITEAEEKKSKSKVDKEQSIWITVNILFGDLKVKIGSKGFKFSPNKGENISTKDECATLKYPYLCAVCFVKNPIKRGETLSFQADDINKVGPASKNCSFKLAISKSNPEEFMSSADKYCDITSLPVIHFEKIPTKCKNAIRIELTTEGTVEINYENGTIKKELYTEQVYCVFELGRIQLRCGLKERQINADNVIPIVRTPIDQPDVPDSVYKNSKRELDEIRHDAEEISIYSDDYNPIFESRNIEGAITSTENEPNIKYTGESKFKTTRLGVVDYSLHDKIESLSSRLVLIEETINKLNIGKESTIQSSEMQDLRSEIKEIKRLLTKRPTNEDGDSNASNNLNVKSQSENSKPLHEIIREHFQMLVSMLEINSVLDCLYQAGNITMEDFQRLRQLSKSDTAEANRELLFTISRRQNLDTEFLEDILIKSKQDGILAVMFPHRYDYYDKKQKDIRLSWLVDNEEFHSMLSQGEFLSYEHRLSLGGQCKAGKSTLASVLIGEEIPLKWNSTDGLVIFFGRNGIDIEKRKMVPLNEGKKGHEVLEKVLRGNPDVRMNMVKSEHLVRTTHTDIQPEVKKNIKESELWTRKSRESQEIKHRTHQSVTKHETKEVKHTSTSTSKTYISSAAEQFQSFEVKKWQLQSDILEEVKNGQYKTKIAPSDLIDFGGQKSYDMTHQLFIQHSGSFLLMFDGRFGLHNQLDDYPDGVNAASILKHWVDSILAYTEDIEDIMPMILFAATHRDQCKKNKDKLRESFIRDIKKMFSLHEKKSHIHLDMVYFINAIDKSDVEIQRMTDQIVTFAMKQSSWGQRRPMQWVPLELQITNMRMKNINIIRKEDLRIVNKLNGDLALNERQLDDFLLVQHSLGKLMYYHIAGLDQFIIVHTPAMVNILRSFVTDEKFFPKDKNLKSILEKLTETGKIYKSDLLKLWQQDQFNQYMPENSIKDFVVELLIHLDVLIIPKAFKQTTSSAIVYIVPCMIKAIRSSSFNLNDRQKESTICIKYSIKRHSIPPALAYKVIGAALNAWPLKYESKRVCLYHKAAVLNVSEDNELRIRLDDNRVMVYLANDQSLLSISPDVAASVQECLTKNMELSLLFHYNSFGRKMQLTEISDLYTTEVGIPCGSDVCFLSVQEVMKKDRWICEKGKKHDTRYLRYWFFNKTQKTCGPGCKGLNDNELQTEPSDKHLVRLGSQIDFNVFRDFVLNLGMASQTWESIQSTYASHSSEGIRAMALKQWKNSNLSKLKDPALKDLSDALTKANQNSHLICQIFREKSELFEIADLNLQEIPSDQHLKDLSIQIGNCPLQLGIELGLSFTEVEQSLFRFPKDLPGLVEDILAKWKTKSKVKTIHSLMMALERLEAGGVRYLRDISKCSK